MLCGPHGTGSLAYGNEEGEKSQVLVHGHAVDTEAQHGQSGRSHLSWTAMEPEKQVQNMTNERHIIKAFRSQNASLHQRAKSNLYQLPDTIPILILSIGSNHL